MKAAGFFVGVGFGFVLGWARLTDYDVIHRMLLLREFDVFLMMGAAMATAAVAARLLRTLGARTLVGGAPVAWSITRPTRDHVVGSVIFGTGWAIAGTCPGPVAAQLGRGQLAALFTLAGMLCGVALLAYVKRRSQAAALSSPAEDAATAQPGL
jgi:uncharacterized protein